jgi:hypothetical protein
MSHALRAFAVGLRTVLLSPLLVAGVTLATIWTVVPFGLVLGSRLQTSLATQQPVSAGAVDIDPEWWMEFRVHARGLEATFTPAIIGVAAPLDNLSAILDASPRPWALALPVAFSTVVWAFLWGGILHRFQQERRIGLGEFIRAGTAHAPRLLVISVAALAAYAVLYFLIHPVLFDLIFDWLAELVSSERNAFFVRVLIYLVFGIFLMTAALVVDYARISVVTSASSSGLRALGAGLQFVRSHKLAVFALYMIAGLVLATLLTIYGTSEVYGGTRLGGWRAVAIGQAYIIARLILRLTLAAAEVRLYRGRRRGDAVASRD